MGSDAEGLFRRLLDGIAKGDWSNLAELYADDALVVIPFAGIDGLRLEGREAIADHFARASAAPFSIKPTNVRIHRTEDSEAIVGEFDYELVARDGTVRGVVPNIQWLKAKDGLIVQSRDYHHHEAIAAAAQSALAEA